MNWRKWLDDFVLAGKGILLATREKRFWFGFVPTFIFFGMLINLLSGGFSKFELMWATGFSGTMAILRDAFLAIFGVNQIFVEWLPTFLLAFLQGVLVALIVLLWQKKAQKKSKESGVGGKSDSESNSASVEKAGIITGLIALGAGCPTCGTTLITPLLGAVFSTGSLAIAGAISTVVTILAVVIAILSLKRLGVETYVIIINEKYLEKKARRLAEKEKKALPEAGKKAREKTTEVQSKKKEIPAKASEKKQTKTVKADKKKQTKGKTKSSKKGEEK